MTRLTNYMGRSLELGAILALVTVALSGLVQDGLICNRSPCISASGLFLNVSAYCAQTGSEVLGHGAPSFSLTNTSTPSPLGRGDWAGRPTALFLEGTPACTPGSPATSHTDGGLDKPVH